MNHIREKLPDMKARLNTLMGQTQQELNSFGDATFLGEQHRGSLILKLMTEFARDFVSSIEGTSLDISTKELCGGARIYYIFNDVFGHALQSIDPTQNLTVTDIRTAIRNSTGPRPSMFVPEVAFDLLVKPQIRLLESPSLRCVELVYEELMKICHNSTSPELQRFPGLHAQLVEVVSELLRERLGPTSEYVSSLIQIQAAYINTNHPDFQAGTAAIARAGAQISQAPPRPPISPDGSVLDGDDSSSDSDTPLPVNGSTMGHHHGKGSTISVPEARNSGSKILEATKSGHFRASSHSGPRSPLPGSAPAGLGSSPNHNANNAKETFLNYFFGGPNGPNGMGPGPAGASHHRRGGPEARGAPSSAHDILPDLGTRRSGGAGSLDQTNAAFDMKSLSKHIDPSEAPIHLTPKEEMEANLIRSLIASYFNIVRQTIQDLTPKAIMHLLVSCVYHFGTDSRSTSRAMRSSSVWSRSCTSRTCLASCCTRTRRSSRSGRASSPCWTRTRRRSVCCPKCPSRARRCRSC
jgi:dynamin 1-like protein